MNAKEKARELVDKFKDFADEDYIDSKHQFELNETRLFNAKQCALIAVDLVLDVDCYDMSEYEFEKHIEYYEQVKKQIELL